MNKLIKVNDFNGLNFEEIQKHSEELEEYTGLLPSFILLYINISNYNDNLREHGLYDEILKERINRRQKLRKAEDKSEIKLKELIKWINENPNYTNLINLKS